MTWKEELMSAEVKAKKEPLPYSAQQRVQAVLSIWSERRRTRQVCRELAIHPSALYAWERRALAAMIEALGHREHGRPSRPSDAEKEALQRQAQELQAKFQVLEQTARIRQALEEPDKKKNEVAEMMVTTLARLKQQVHWPYQRLCESLGLPYASFRRWKHRLACGRSALLQPGPKKVAAFDPAELRGQLFRLQHGRKRSQRVGELYHRYQDQISRHDLEALVEAARREHAQQRQAELRHITWQVPGLVWSLDDAELARFADQKLHLHQVQDLASRYKFEPWVGERMVGETVALHLEQLFEQHGPPLVLKRDNGSNLNHHAVDEVLGRYLVIPLNSPPHYPPYNGGMEWAVRELKPPLVEKIFERDSTPDSPVEL